MFQNSRLNKKGFMLVETIVAIALVVISFSVLLGVVFLAMNVPASVRKQMQANALVSEEFEALRNFRDGTQWATDGLATKDTGPSNPYHMAVSSGSWSIVSGSETTGIFTRQFIIDRVSRDPITYGIEPVYNASHDSVDTRKITVTVSWENKIIQSATYLTNWK